MEEGALVHTWCVLLWLWLLWLLGFSVGIFANLCELPSVMSQGPPTYFRQSPLITRTSFKAKSLKCATFVLPDRMRVCTFHRLGFAKDYGPFLREKWTLDTLTVLELKKKKAHDPKVHLYRTCGDRQLFASDHFVNDHSPHFSIE